MKGAGTEKSFRREVVRGGDVRQGLSVEASAEKTYFARDAKKVQTRQDGRHFNFLIHAPPPPLSHSRLARQIRGRLICPGISACLLFI